MCNNIKYLYNIKNKILIDKIYFFVYFYNSINLNR